MMIQRILGCILILGGMVPVFSQPVTYPVEGVHRASPGPIALINCTLISAPGEKTEGATILIEQGKITAAGKNISLPSSARITDMHQAWIYPGLIDLWVKHTAWAPESSVCWNNAVHPQYSVEFSRQDSIGNKLEKYRNEGFTTVLLSPDEGIFRGSGTLTHTGTQLPGKEIISSGLGMFLSFQKGNSQDEYPTSLMGSIALIRQTFLDAAWYKNAINKTEHNTCLEILNTAQKNNTPFFFESGTVNDPSRALSISREFNQPFILKASGKEYEKFKTGQYANTRMILPLNFPLPPDLSKGEVSLYALRHWAWAPNNPVEAVKAGVPFTFTTEGLKNISEWRNKAQKAIDRGLKPKEALAAFTTRPAEWLNMKGKIGSIQAGAYADLAVFSGDIFQPESYLIETWVQGNQYPVSTPKGPEGVYSMRISEYRFDSLCFSGTDKNLKAEIRKKEGKIIPVKIGYKGGTWELSFVPDTTENIWICTGVLHGDTLSGIAGNQNGKYFPWTAIHTGALPAKVKVHTPDTLSLQPLPYPNRAWGHPELPKAETFLIKNVKIWTNLDDSLCESRLGIKSDLPGGLLENADVLISEGKILKVGKNLNADKAIIIEGKGKHLSPGIIDEHSHIAIERGVNEGTQAITAEVRIGDVLRSEDLNIFRQLAGGVTCSQLLHGSANPIGGQSAIIKLRWGMSAEEMKMQEARPFIKFALGENVKQSNWGEKYHSRFPQSRPGVEQIMHDAFLRAQEYRHAQKNTDNKNFRTDLELETLAEILEGKRFVTCHSYVQSEITMLMRLAEKFNFRINTFTHVLEGYKIAEKIKLHGASASTFSDWWAYKYEVMDAIPHNGALLAQAGVNTGFNSDDSEMGRRLNQEAAKAIKYGGLSETEALKLVTLNPAKMLRIETWVGTVEPGKHADLVLWSDHPLSVYSKAEKTWIDGKLFYDIEKLPLLAQEMENEKAWLMLRASQAAGKSGTGTAEEITDIIYHCDTLEDSDHENQHTH